MHETATQHRTINEDGQRKTLKGCINLLIRIFPILFEDKDMQIVFPTAVAQIIVKPTVKDSSNQTKKTKLTLESLVYFTEIVSIKPIPQAKEYSPAEIQTDEVVAQEASRFFSEMVQHVKSS